MDLPMRLHEHTQVTELVDHIHAVFDEEMVAALRRIYARAVEKEPTLTDTQFFSYLPDNLIPLDLRDRFRGV